MGFDMGILNEARPVISFYELIMYVQPAILQKRVGTDLNSQERDMQRAAFVRSQFER